MKAYKKRELRFLRQQKPELARRVTAPRTAADVSFFHSPGPSRQWAGAFCYLASDASNSTTARAISETMINRLMAGSFSGLRRAERRQSSEKKQPCGCFITCLCPARNNTEGPRGGPWLAKRLFSIAKGPKECSHEIEAQRKRHLI